MPRNFNVLLSPVSVKEIDKMSIVKMSSSKKEIEQLIWPEKIVIKLLIK